MSWSIPRHSSTGIGLAPDTVGNLLFLITKNEGIDVNKAFLVVLVAPKSNLTIFGGCMIKLRSRRTLMTHIWLTMCTHNMHTHTIAQASAPVSQVQRSGTQCFRTRSIEPNLERTCLSSSATSSAQRDTKQHTTCIPTCWHAHTHTIVCLVKFHFTFHSWKLTFSQNKVDKTKNQKNNSRRIEMLASHNKLQKHGKYTGFMEYTILPADT